MNLDMHVNSQESAAFHTEEEEQLLHRTLPLSFCPGAKTAETPAGKTQLMHFSFVLSFM